MKHDNADLVFETILQLITAEDAYDPAEEDEEDAAERAIEFERLAALGATMPPAVKALFDAIESHTFGLDLTCGNEGFECEPYPLTMDDHAFGEEIQAALLAAGSPGNQVVHLGATGGGEDLLLLTWDESGYNLVTWGVQEGELSGDVGTFTDYIDSWLEADDQGDCSDDVLHLLRSQRVSV